MKKRSSRAARDPLAATRLLGQLFGNYAGQARDSRGRFRSGDQVAIRTRPTRTRTRDEG